MKYKAKKTSRTNTYVNYRLKINYVLSFFPWPRLSNRQSHVDLWSLLSALIIWTHRGNMQKNLFLFHYFKVNRRRWLADWGDYYRLFPLQPSTSLLQPQRQERKEGSVCCKAAARLHLTGFPHGCRLRTILFPLFSRMLNEGINEWVHRLVFTPAGMIQSHSSPWAQIIVHGGGKPTTPRL